MVDALSQIQSDFLIVVNLNSDGNSGLVSSRNSYPTKLKIVNPMMKQGVSGSVRSIGKRELYQENQQ